MSHTPGPWTADGHEWGSVSEVAHDIKNIDDQYLIAAAPDLLAACKLALGAFERNDCIDWSDLEKAIAKAEGK